MRTIKFRGKSKENGEWLYGDLEYNRQKDIARIHIYNKDGMYEGQEIIDADTIGQFTGLYDCHGKEIYEGDILDFNGIIVEVRFVRGFFAFLADGNLDEELCGDCRTDLFTKVIGNIYENSDMLKVRRTDL